MTEEAAYAIVNAVVELTQAVQANTAAMLLDPCRGRAEADEVVVAVQRAQMLEQVGRSNASGAQIGD